MRKPTVYLHPRHRDCKRAGCFFFNDTATTEIYTLSLHDALPISPPGRPSACAPTAACSRARPAPPTPRSEEHTSELQSRLHLVCRLLLEKKKKTHNTDYVIIKKTKIKK